MDQSQRSVTAAANPRIDPRAAITDLFNRYLGISGHQEADDSIREPPQKHALALTSGIPRNEQFILDFELLQTQFADLVQLRSVTESVLISLVIQCCSHAPSAEFLLFALRSLCSISYSNWDTLLPSLLSSVSSAEVPAGQQGSPRVPSASSTSLSQSEMMPSTSVIANTCNFQPANPLSTSTSVLTGSPARSTTRMNSSIRDNVISNLHQLCCKIIITGLECNLKPVTYAEIFYHILNWLDNWDQRKQGNEKCDGKSRRPDKGLTEWLHSCLNVIWLLVEEDKCRLPFYELLRSVMQSIENIPADEAFFNLVREIHWRRDMMAMHMQMLDQHLHCPTFGTHRIFPRTTPNASVESVANLPLYSPITYPSVLGEPLHGEDLAASIQRGSLDWDRALRCIRHAIRSTPSPEWRKGVLVIAPCYRGSAQVSIPGAVFTSDMICEAIIDRIVELLKLTNSEINCWQDWLVFMDIFFNLMSTKRIDFVDFVDKLGSRLTESDRHMLNTNHVTWLLAQIIRVDHVMAALNDDSRKVETIRKILSFHREDSSSDPNNPPSILLDFISSCQNLLILSLNASNRGYLNNEQLQKGRQIDEWWRQVGKEGRMNMDDRSTGMFWVVSFGMARTVCDTVMNWLFSAGITELLPGANAQPNEILRVTREVSPLPISLLSGFSIDLCSKLALQMDAFIFFGEIVPSIAMVETYTRLLLIAPYSLFYLHSSASLTPGELLLTFEIVNYRLLPLYRYHRQCQTLMYEVAKRIYALKGRRGDHREFRLAENLCINLILSLRDIFPVKSERQGPTEFTETLNRIAIITLAITIKTRGIADADHLLYLPTMLNQILETSQHTWSQKTLRYFPSLLRDVLMLRADKRGQAIEAWQKSEWAVIEKCTQIFSSTADSFPQHRQYLCAGAWIVMEWQPEDIYSGNLAQVLREFSPEEVTSNIYLMVDVLLHDIHMKLQHGSSFQDLLLKTCANLILFSWTHELIPMDILLLALIDRDDDPHALPIVIRLLESQELQLRVNLYCINRGPPEHWLYTGMFTRNDLQVALGNHLSSKNRYPTFFDDIAARLLPVIPLVVYRLIENDETESADRILAIYSIFLAYHPFRFTFVREILAYFFGHLPGMLIKRILNVLDLSKIPFSEWFQRHIGSSNPAICPPVEYFSTLLLALVNNVIPPLGNASNTSVRGPRNKTPANACEGQKAFYQIQDPGTYTQLILETAVIEILSLSVSASQIVSSLVQIVVHIQGTLIQSSYGLHGAYDGGSTESSSAGKSTPSVSESGYTWQELSCFLIQACGLLLAQLPPEFHSQLYTEATRIIKETWWLNDGNISPGELHTAVSYALLDPSLASEDNPSTAIGNIVTLLHSFFSNLPHEWLEETHVIIKHLRPVTSVAMLRIAFRIMGPLLPRVANAHNLFNKILSLLLNTLEDVFGKNSQPLVPADVSEIKDLIDFLHHVIHYEAQGGPVQASSKPRPEVLALCGKAAESLRPDVQLLLSHLKLDMNSSIYAASHPS